MTFTVSGSQITQTDGAARNITAIASNSAGTRTAITVSSAHGMLGGDVVHIEGNGTYDGVHRLLSTGTSGSTFIIDVPYSAGATATGTASQGDDAADIGTAQIDAAVGGFPYTVENQINRTLAVSGGLLLDPHTTYLVVGRVTINSGGFFKIGVPRTTTDGGGFTSRFHLPALYVRHRGTNPQNDPAIDILSGGTLDWDGAAILCHAAIYGRYDSAGSQATVRIRDGLLYMEGAANNGFQYKLRFNGDDVIIDGLRMFGGNLTMQRPITTLRGFEPEQYEGIQIPGAAPDDDVFTISDYAGGRRGNLQDYRGTGKKARFVNSRTGSDIILRAHSQTASFGGLAEVIKTIQFDVTDPQGAHVGGVTYHGRDTDHDRRTNYVAAPTNVMFVNDRVYSGTTPTSATVGHPIDVLTAAYVDNDDGLANANPTRPQGGTNRNGAIIDYRGKNNDNSDLFDFYLWKYDRMGATVLDAELKGTGIQRIPVTMPPDPDITAATAADAAAITGITFANNAIVVHESRTLDELYDHMKYLKTQAAHIEQPSPGARLVEASGTALTTPYRISVGVNSTLSAGARFLSIESTSTHANPVAIDAGSALTALYKSSAGVGLILNLQAGDSYRIAYVDAAGTPQVTPVTTATGPEDTTLPASTQVFINIARAGQYIVYDSVNTGALGATYTPRFEALPGSAEDITAFTSQATTEFIESGGSPNVRTLRITLAAVPALELGPAHARSLLEWLNGQAAYQEAVTSLESANALRVTESGEIDVHDDLRLEFRLAPAVTTSNYSLRIPFHITNPADLLTPENPAGRSVMAVFVNDSGQVNYGLVRATVDAALAASRLLRDVKNNVANRREYDPATSVETVYGDDGTTVAGQYDWQQADGTAAGTGTPYRRVPRD